MRRYLSFFKSISIGFVFGCLNDNARNYILLNHLTIGNI